MFWGRGGRVAFRRLALPGTNPLSRLTSTAPPRGGAFGKGGRFVGLLLGGSPSQSSALWAADSSPRGRAKGVVRLTALCQVRDVGRSTVFSGADNVLLFETLGDAVRPCLSLWERCRRRRRRGRAAYWRCPTGNPPVTARYVPDRRCVTCPMLKKTWPVRMHGLIEKLFAPLFLEKAGKPP